VLVDEPIAHLMSRKCIDAEGRDAEVEPDRPRGNAAVIELVDLVDLRRRVTAHSTLLFRVWEKQATQPNERRPAKNRPPRRGDTVDAHLGERTVAWAQSGVIALL
jgi:hypothetical protein